MIYKNAKRKKNDNKFKSQLKICMVFNVISTPLDLVNRCALAPLRYAHVNQLVLNCCIPFVPHQEKRMERFQRERVISQDFQISKFIADSMDSLPTN